MNRTGSREAGKVSGRRKYKELTSQQLRSFYESARLGSFSEAARHLGLAHPTVWEQVRALEGHLGKELFESRGRRLHLTGGRQDSVRTGEPVSPRHGLVAAAIRGGDVRS